MVNGIWIFMLTLVPFSTAWVGAAPFEFLPEFLYPLNLLLWVLAFHWLGHQIKRDNPGIGWDDPVYYVWQLYPLHGLSFIRPEMSINLIGFSAVVLFIRTFFGKNATRKMMP